MMRLYSSIHIYLAIGGVSDGKAVTEPHRLTHGGLSGVVTGTGGLGEASAGQDIPQ